MRETNTQGIGQDRDAVLASQKISLKTLEFIPALNAARLGKLTACLLAASNRNDYAIIMILLVGNVRVTEQPCSLKKYRVMFALFRNVINARLENFTSGLPVVHTRVLRESNIL